MRIILKFFLKSSIEEDAIFFFGIKNTWKEQHNCRVGLIVSYKIKDSSVVSYLFKRQHTSVPSLSLLNMHY